MELPLPPLHGTRPRRDINKFRIALQTLAANACTTYNDRGLFGEYSIGVTNKQFAIDNPPGADGVAIPRPIMTQMPALPAQPNARQLKAYDIQEKRRSREQPELAAITAKVVVSLGVQHMKGVVSQSGTDTPTDPNVNIHRRHLRNTNASRC